MKYILLLPCIVLICFVFALIQIPISNNSDWIQYFPEAKLDNKQIIQTISNISNRKRDYPFSANYNASDIAELAGYGGEIVPYLLKCAGERITTFVPFNPEGGICYFQRYSPYLPLANEVILALNNTAAIPDLKK